MATLTDRLIDAYDVKGYQISGAPDWAARGGGYYYDLIAKAEDEETMGPDQARRMLQALLADRFQLKLHWETRDLPVYNLAAAKGGPKLKEVAANAPSIKPTHTSPPGVIEMRTPIPMLIRLIAQQTDRPVIDQTGLAGIYEYNWPQPSPDVLIFTVVREELGLILKPDKVPTEMLVIDHAAQPSAN